MTQAPTDADSLLSCICCALTGQLAGARDIYSSCDAQTGPFEMFQTEDHHKFLYAKRKREPAAKEKAKGDNEERAPLRHGYIEHCAPSKPAEMAEPQIQRHCVGPFTFVVFTLTTFISAANGQCFGKTGPAPCCAFAADCKYATCANSDDGDEVGCHSYYQYCMWKN